MCVGAGLALLLLNVLYRYGAERRRERDAEERRASTSRKHGRWPDDEQRLSSAARLVGCDARAVLRSARAVLRCSLTALGSVARLLPQAQGRGAGAAGGVAAPLHSTIALFRSPIYTIGCVVATTSWGFHVARARRWRRSASCSR